MSETRIGERAVRSLWTRAGWRAMLGRMKSCYIIAEPNGAGKTTFATTFLPREAECRIFINADLIAAGLSPLKPQDAAMEAGRMMLRKIHEAVSNGKSFAFESTLSGLSYLRHIPDWK